MKKFLCLTFLMASTLTLTLLTSCGDESTLSSEESLSSTNTESSETTSENSSSASSESSSVDQGIVYSSISAIKENGIVDQTYYLEGVVAYFKMGTYSSIDGFFLVDNTDSIYVYSKEVVATLAIGNKVKLSGTYAKYILEAEQNIADQIGYTGARQISNPVIISNDKRTDNTINTDLFAESSIYEVSNMDVKVNVTSNIYKVKAKIRKDQQQGYKNYYFDDPKEIGSMYAYSNNNGNDYDYLDQFCDSNYRECYIAVINAKATVSGGYYRMIPLYIGSIYTKTNQDIVNGVALRAYESFNNEFYEADEPFALDNLAVDTLHPEVTISYTPSNILISVNQNNKLIVQGNAGKVDVIVKATLGEVVGTITKEVNIVSANTPEGLVDIVSVRNDLNNDGNEVTIMGVLVSKGYNPNSRTYYIADATGSMVVTCGSSAASVTLNNGEQVAFKGTISRELKDESNGGNLLMKDAELLYHDSKSHPIPLAFATKTVQEVLNLYLDGYKYEVGNIYRVTGKIVKYVTSYSSLYEIQDSDGKYLNCYSGSASSTPFLDAYEGLTVTISLGIRDRKNSSNSNYRTDFLTDNIVVVS